MNRAIFVFLGFVVSLPALAGPMDMDEPPASGRRTKGDEFVILGVEQLPDFTVLIDRENLSKNYDLVLKESFLPKISEALEKPPF